MITAFALHLLLVGSLVTLAATFGDRAARRLCLPTRYVWMAAVLLSVIVPLLALGTERSRDVREVALPQATVSEVVPVAGDLFAAPVQRNLIPEIVLPGWVGRVDSLLLTIWVIVALAALARLYLAHNRLRSNRSRWPSQRLFGRPVRVTPGEGPAAVGLLKPEIVVPVWAFESEPSVVRLMLAHEQEHVRARDPLLLLLADVAVALAPWHPALHWQRRQLRLAVELDCDARVLRTHRDTRRYAELLLRVAHRPSNSMGRLAAAVALAPRPSTLERRISAMTEKRSRKPIAAMVAAGAAVLLGVAACEAPRATAPVPESEVPVSEIVMDVTSAAADSASELERRPSLTIVTDSTAEVNGTLTLKADSIFVLRGVVRDSLSVLRRRGGVDPSEPVVALYVVDGVIVRNVKDLEGLGIAPEQIESIEVVKGDAAKRMYGAEAAGGVVSIYLRDGKPPAPRAAITRVPGRAVAVPDAAVASEVPVTVRSGQGIIVRQTPQAGESPLIVLDGVVMTGNTDEVLNSIAPESIHSIEVIKGEAAVRVYGSRAANGVVVITTKPDGGF